MDPSKIKKVLEISGAVISAAVSLVSLIMVAKDGRKVRNG